MAERVNPKRRYDSPHRRQQAAATRLHILQAAQRLLERQGYAATTMAAIAIEAGVSLKTVYLAFQTKSGVVRALWDVLLRGPVDRPVAAQPWYREVIQERDPQRRLRLNPRNRHLVDAQPPRRVAAAGRYARLDTGAIRAVVRRYRLRTAAQTRHPPPKMTASNKNAREGIEDLLERLGGVGTADGRGSDREGISQSSSLSSA